MEALWQMFLLAVSLSTIQGNLAQSAGSCEQRVSEELHIDVFSEVLSNHSAVIPDSVRIAPLVGNMDPSIPAFDFRGVGLHITDNYLSDSIRAQSCSSNEITMFGSMLFKEEDSEGPVVELSYADSFGPSLPVFSFRVDALADELIVAYRHLGNLHTEVFKVRLTKGRWRSYGVTLTGNQVLVYDDCKLAHQRVIPLPDYCVNDSNVVLSVAESTYQFVELTENRMLSFLQNVAVHFGPRGIQHICPEIPEPCPSCGQFLRLVKKVYLLNQEVEELRMRVAELEGREPIVDCPTGAAECTHTVDGENVTFANGSFRSFSDQTVCYCLDGVVECTQSSELCLDGNVVIPTQTPSTDATNDRGGQLNPDVSTTAPPGCAPVDSIPALAEGETYSNKQGDTCVITACDRGRFGFQHDVKARYSCSNNYTSCNPSFSALQIEISKCCFICSGCDFESCPADSVCVANDRNEASCVCRQGLQRDPSSGQCVDMNECEDPEVCPSQSVCNNTVGSFQCVCNPGYEMTVSSRGMTCEDIDECAEPALNNCTGDTPCHNTPGSFVCECPAGTVLSPGGTCEAFCESDCQNGGQCIGNDTCECHPGYTGRYCESDVNECDLKGNYCNHPRAVCINTMGSYFCRCEAGYMYVGKGQVCEDIDECALGIHDCPKVKGSTCINVAGSYHCLCPSTDNPGIRVNCTGSCVFGKEPNALLVPNGEFRIVPRCKNCTCVDGKRTCFRMQCDCSAYPPRPRDCCSDCYKKDCEIDTVEGRVKIRPGQTWVNPRNRCQRTFCAERDDVLYPVTTDLSENCPVLNCPADLTIQPMGKCCPVCLLPQCTEENNKQVIRLRNGCQTCLCANSEWTCQQKTQCAAIDCAPEHILFSEDGCCPVCASEALNLGLCEA